MVDARPRRRADDRRRRRRPHGRRAVRRRRADRRDATSSPGRCGSPGARPRVHVDKRIPHGGGLGGGSADAAAVLRWAGVDDLGAASRLGADVPFCLVGGRARVRGIGEVVEPLPSSRSTSRWSCRRCASARRPSTGRGTSWAGRRPTAPTTSSRRRSPSSRRWPVARPHRRAGRRRRRCSPAAGRRGSSRRARRRPRRLAGRGRRAVVVSPARQRRRRRRSDRVGYLRRWWRVRRSIFLCFFLRIRLRRFLISEPIRPFALGDRPHRRGAGYRSMPGPARYRELTSTPSGVVQSVGQRILVP